MPDFAIEVRDLSKVFGKEAALTGVNLTAQTGAVTCVLGPTEAGKTTLLRCLLGEYTISGGSATVLGMDIETDSMAVRRATGYAPEGVFFDPTMDAGAAVHFAASFNHTGDALKSAVTAALTAVRFTGKENQKVVKMKAAAQARVALACAIAPNTRLILLDNVAADLDPLDRSELFDTLNAWQQANGASVVFTSRLAEDAEHATHIAFMIGGRIVEQSSVADVVQKSTFKDDDRRAIEEHFKDLLKANRGTSS